MEKDEKVLVRESVAKKNPYKYGHFRVLGVSLVIITMLLLFTASILTMVRYSPQLQSLLLGGVVNEQRQVLTVTEGENIVINVVQQSTDSVVSIAVKQSSTRQGAPETVSNIGTGFIVDPNGILITNQHVVSDTTASYTVVTMDGQEFDVVEIIRDSSNDIAVLKIDATNLPVLELGNSDEIMVGQTVIAIGNPLGRFAGSVTTGVVSGVNRSVTTSAGWFGNTTKVYENVIQTDAAVNPGNSGGPLINTEGKVIGVNFATSSNAENISFAIPVNIVKQKLDEYRTYGRFIRSYVGVTYQMISSYEVLFYDDLVVGALVVGVDPEGPAAKAGIKQGDIITKINGKEVDSSFASIIQSHKVGEEVNLEVWNDGDVRSVKATLMEASQ
jgi:serine protease Do